MKLKENCTYWTMEWTKRTDAIGRRYTEAEPVWIEHRGCDAEARRKAGEAMWTAMGFTKVSDRSWTNGDASVVITYQADKEIEYEIQSSRGPQETIQ
jgi:hypothetical protein